MKIMKVVKQFFYRGSLETDQAYRIEHKC